MESSRRFHRQVQGWFQVGVMMSLIGALSGCVQRVAYFPTPAVPVRLGETLHGVDVYVPENGKLIKATATLYAGQWIITHPSEWDDNAKKEFQNVEPNRTK